MKKPILLGFIILISFLILAGCGGGGDDPAPAPAKTYTVSYNSNGGTGTMTDANTYLSGATVTVLANSFTKTGYTFVGWYPNADGSGMQYGTSFAIGSANTTLYAKWTQTYTKAILKINLAGNLGDKTISGAGFTLTLPANVTPEIIDNSVAGTVVTPSGTFAGGTLTPAVYIAATATTPGTLKIALANSIEAGVTAVGEVATVTLQLANGVAPAAADFKFDAAPVVVTDTLYDTITGMTASVTSVTLQ